MRLPRKGTIYTSSSYKRGIPLRQAKHNNKYHALTVEQKPFLRVHRFKAFAVERAMLSLAVRITQAFLLTTSPQPSRTKVAPLFLSSPRTAKALSTETRPVPWRTLKTTVEADEEADIRGPGCGRGTWAGVVEKMCGGQLEEELVERKYCEKRGGGGDHLL